MIYQHWKSNPVDDDPNPDSSNRYCYNRMSVLPDIGLSAYLDDNIIPLITIDLYLNALLGHHL